MLTWLDRRLCAKHWQQVCALREAGQTSETIRAEHTLRKNRRAV